MTQEQVRREARQMTREEVLIKAVEGKLTWLQAADILGITTRHMRRLRKQFQLYGYSGVCDYRAGLPRKKRIPTEVVEELCRLRREKYPEFSVQHFYEFATEKHGLEIGYTWTKEILQAAGLAEKTPGRGRYRRRRERRPLRGMLLHLDASTHQWIEGLPMKDLVVMLDDADGRILYARFVDQEGTVSTLQALEHVLRWHGRFCEFYTDRASHFCNTTHAEQGPDEVQRGQVPRVLKALGIRHILARSPEARGRSERAFGTVQGRLPQELKVAGITNYEQANEYLVSTFVPDFNQRFTVEPAQPESAFVPLGGLDLKLLLSVQEERTVKNDSTVAWNGLLLQLPKTGDRPHYVRCPVIVHQFLDDTLGVSHLGKLLATYTRDGELLSPRAQPKRAVEMPELGTSADACPQLLGQPADGLPTSPQPRRRGSACAVPRFRKKTDVLAIQPTTSGHL
jgi:hypothetical protein